MPKPRVVLAMIVKDEAHIIAKCLSQLRPFVDAWCIVDTGSTDETISAVVEAMDGLPGELHERDWVSFRHNRQECFELARKLGDYVLVHDADDVWECPEGFEWPEITLDGYTLTIRGGELEWPRHQLLRSDVDWTYGDPVHAVVDPRGKTVAHLDGPVVRPTTDGRRHLVDPNGKYLKDAAIYEAEIAKEPANLRYRFYLAESYRYAGEARAALAAYLARAQLGGWRQEVWYSLYQAARLAAELEGRAPAIELFERAYNHWPARAEAPCALAALHAKNRDYSLAYLWGRIAYELPQAPGDAVFVEHQVYSWRAADQYAIACYYTGRFAEARRVNEQLLGVVPETERPRIVENLRFCREALSYPGDGRDRRRLLVVGCGRSGTGFLARVLAEGGVPCGHEQVFGPRTVRPHWGRALADASWLALPWLPTLRGSDAYVLHVVRDPLANARSWLGVGMFDVHPSAGHRPYIDALRRFAPGVMERETPLERWLAHWVVWNEISCRYADETLQIEQLDELEGGPLCRLVAELGLGEEGDVREAYAAVPRNFNRRTVDSTVTWGAIEACDPDLVRRLKALCRRFGYRADRQEDAGPGSVEPRA